MANNISPSILGQYVPKNFQVVDEKDQQSPPSQFHVSESSNQKSGFMTRMHEVVENNAPIFSSIVAGAVLTVPALLFSPAHALGMLGICVCLNAILLGAFPPCGLEKFRAMFEKLGDQFKHDHMLRAGLVGGLGFGALGILACSSVTPVLAGVAACLGTLATVLVVAAWVCNPGHKHVCDFRIR